MHGYTHSFSRTLAFLNPHIIVYAFHTNTPPCVPVHFLITSLLSNYFHSPNARDISVSLYTVTGVKTANPSTALRVSPSLDVEQRTSGVTANTPERIKKKKATTMGEKKMKMAGSGFN